MRKIILFFLMTFMLSNMEVKAQTDTIPEDFCISPEEYQLHQLINDYRKAFALPAIVLSKSLSYVAITHARDLAANFDPDSVCNMHSWSDKGRWKSICYPSEQSRKNNIRLKAKEIIGYPGDAYELTYWSNAEIAPRQILSFWRENKVAGNMLLNQDKWLGKTWKAMGIGIEGGYAVLWLGQEVDYEVSTKVCGSSTQVLNNALPETIVPSVKQASKNAPVYYITIGSYNARKDGATAVKSYKEMGYPKAILVEVDNKFRVAIDYFTLKEEADKALKKYEQKFKGAWILTN